MSQSESEQINNLPSTMGDNTVNQSDIVHQFTLEVNHHVKYGGSFWMMINPYNNGGQGLPGII